MSLFGLWVRKLKTNNLQNHKCMDSDHVDFITYCIGSLSRRLGLSAREVYQRLKTSGILMDYIVPCYDVLHTFGKEYLMEDLTDYMSEKGVL